MLKCANPTLVIIIIVMIIAIQPYYTERHHTSKQSKKKLKMNFNRVELLIYNIEEYTPLINS